MKKISKNWWVVVDTADDSNPILIKKWDDEYFTRLFESKEIAERHAEERRKELKKDLVAGLLQKPGMIEVVKCEISYTIAGFIGKDRVIDLRK